MARFTCTHPCMPGMPRLSGWSCGNDPSPCSVVMTGIPVYSASASSSADAPDWITPLPTRMSGRLEDASRAAASRTAPAFTSHWRWSSYPARSSVTFRGVSRALFVAAEHVMQLFRVLRQRVVEWHDGAAGDAEDHIHALAHECFAEDLRAGAQIRIRRGAHFATPANASLGCDVQLGTVSAAGR